MAASGLSALGLGVFLVEFVRPSDPALLFGPNPLEVGLERRSEEHTSELQSRSDLVCRLLLEKKKHTVARKPRLVLSRPTVAPISAGWSTTPGHCRRTAF